MSDFLSRGKPTSKRSAKITHLLSYNVRTFCVIFRVKFPVATSTGSLNIWNINLESYLLGVLNDGIDNNPSLVIEYLYQLVRLKLRRSEPKRRS